MLKNVFHFFSITSRHKLRHRVHREPQSIQTVSENRSPNIECRMSKSEVDLSSLFIILHSIFIIMHFKTSSFIIQHSIFIILYFSCPKTIIKVENLSKLYRLGEIGTGSLWRDLSRWWARARGKEDPFQ